MIYSDVSQREKLIKDLHVKVKNEIERKVFSKLEIGFGFT